MKIFLSFLLCTVSLCDFSSAHHNEDEEVYACPNYTISEPITDPFVLQELKRATIQEAWSSSIFEEETLLLSKLIDQVVEIANIDSFHYTQMMLEFTGWGVSFLKLTERIYPSFCPFAIAINKTLDWKSSGNNSKYIEALNAAHEAVYHSLSGTKFTVLKGLGCKNITEPKISKARCWNYGFTFDTDALWEAYGRSIPWTLRNTIEELFSSSLFIEKATATLFYFILLPQIDFIWKATSMEYDLEFFKIFSQSGNSSIGKCCCENWSSRMDVLGDTLTNSIDTAVKDKIKEVENECNA